MADKENKQDNQQKGTSLEKNNTFLKGMVKDFVDIYVPEGVWTNAINAINNSHNGDTGSIGNEQSNTYCTGTSNDYTVIGIIHKYKTEWVVFSVYDNNSEIGIFDEKNCSYRAIINSQCLKFSTFNLITGVCKENYDCTWSVYFQDNLNPDRVLNLDNVPYICYPKTVEVHKTWNNYTVTRAESVNPCGVATKSGGPGITNTIHSLGENYGVVTVNYNMVTVPDRMDIWFDANPATDLPTVTTGGPVSGIGSLTFNKFSTTSTCYIRITGPSGTAWTYTVNCPVVTPETPPIPVIDAGIYYTDIDSNVQQVLSMDYGQSITICALEGSINIDNIADGYSVSAAGGICKEVNETILDPDACGEKDCTNELDCDALRLHPLVNQPCITVNKSNGAGQLNNGSYQAVIAYSENGVKLTDYSMPSNIQSLWNHSGIGGSIDINIDKLDTNFEEYELVVVSIVNQQTIAKKIGNYSINQKVVHLDLILQSLPTIDLELIPLKTVVYDKSEKMFKVGGYLIRSSVTSQPFFNYQPLANIIKAEWIAVEYPADYYWNGGNNVGNMRDEVYPYFIRWVYKTGSRSASFHIPGRASIPSDLVVTDTNDVIDDTKNLRWQVYDTSTIKSASRRTTPDGGIIKYRGDMAFWESTELYPYDHPSVWGDLCNQPIRHHKMPSNETIHIHNNTGDKIYILGIEFSNIQPPVDDNGNIIQDIVGYEILRGSREGNRSIIAKGLFNNMVKYDIQGSTTKGLFQNYPYNDLNGDPFLKDENNLEVKQDIFSFHAPENNLVKPYIGSGNHIKIYTEETGTAVLNGEIPYKHPKFKVMNEDTFAAAIGVSVGIALLSLFGKQSTESTTTGHTTLPFLGETKTTVVPWAIAVPGVGGNPAESSYVMRDPVFNYDNSLTTTSEGGTANAASGLFTNDLLALANKGLSGPVGLAAVFSKIASIISIATTTMFTFYQALDEAFEIVYHLLKYRDYVIQINSHGFYNSFNKVTNTEVPSGVNPSFNRKLKNSGAKYISSGIQDFDSTYRINNLNRNKYLALYADGIIPNPINIDTSKELIPDTRNPLNTFERNIASYYGAIKVDYDNQYGQLYSIVQLPTGSCVIPKNNPSSGLIFGGDTYINRYTEKNPHYFFNTWLFDMPNGTEFNYNNYINGPTPKYYIDSRRYDASLFGLHVDIKIIPKFDFSSPSDLYDLHCTHNPKHGFGVRDSYMYLFNNGVRDFFTESELNMAFRDYGENPWEKFYDSVGDSFNDLSTMFRSDIIDKPIYYKYDLSLSTSKLYNNFKSWGNILPRDYDPSIYTKCFEYYPNRVVYSLPQQSGLKRDNWRNFLRFNYKDFAGKVNNIKSLNVLGALILFEDLEPIQFVGTDTFESKGGVKYTSGDGGLFLQNPQSIVNADDSFEYGTCTSYRSAVNTPYGLFWMSQKTGKVLAYNGDSIDEISRNGMKYWFLENLPSPLLKVYPEFPLYDNALEGISCQAVFDSQYELVYFTKRDYKPTAAFLAIKDFLVYKEGDGFYIDRSASEGILVTKSCAPGYTYNPDTDICEKVVGYNVCPADHVYNSTLDRCILQGTPPSGYIEPSPNICAEPGSLNNTTGLCSYIITSDVIYNPVLEKINIKDYLELIEWTVSYDPKIKAWISFHDWNPDFLIPSNNHFLTIKNNEFWRHNVSKNSFSQYYYADKPWEVEFPIVTPGDITTLRSVEYTLESFIYNNDGKDNFHVLDENFDRAIIFNSEQTSGLLKLNIKPKNDPIAILDYPIVGVNSIDILYSKEENKYRFNQFYDVTKDRGEFSGTIEPMWITSLNGYYRVLNPAYLNYNKEALQHKKFRHYGNKIILRKNISGNKKMILKFVNSKHLNSPR